jgi:hypothetical protein
LPIVVNHAHLNVHTPGFATLLLMLCPQPTEYFIPLSATECIFGKGTRDNLKRGRIPLHRMLREAFQPSAVGVHPASQLDLRRARTGNETRILEQALDHAHSIVNRALEVVQTVYGSAAKHNRCGAGALRTRRRVKALVAWRKLPKDGNTVSADLDALKDVDVAGLFRHGRSHTGKRCRASDATYTTKIKLGGDLENRDTQPVEIVKGKLAHARSCYDNLDAGVRDFLEYLCKKVSLIDKTLRKENAPSLYASLHHE